MPEWKVGGDSTKKRRGGGGGREHDLLQYGHTHFCTLILIVAISNSPVSIS
eukprot:m.52220 g.52220  ORF g.52220 m.52220 type:complete len:51 (-) comp7610_c0_seq1:703-855(-)